MFDITRLQVFIQAAETLNFSEAAKRLNLSQPTVSHHIKALERKIGAELFERAKGHLHLTQAGRFLLPNARQLVRQAVSFQELVESMKEDVVGDLRIACSTTVGKYLLPRFAVRLRHLHPGINISVVKCAPEDVVMRLLEDEADLALISSELHDQGFDIQEFFMDEIPLIVPPDHALATRESISPDELMDEMFFIREASSGTRRVMLTELAKHDISLDDLNILLELGSAEAILEMVADGFGISFVSRMAVSRMLRWGELVEVAVDGLDLRRTIYMVRKKLKGFSRAQEVFWSFIHNPENIDLFRLP